MVDLEKYLVEFLIFTEKNPSCSFSMDDPSKTIEDIVIEYLMEKPFGRCR